MSGGMGMDVRQVARAILDGVRTNAAYVVTHPGVGAALEQRFAAILAATGAADRSGETPGT